MCAVKNLHPFLVAASNKNSDVSVIYQFSRQALPSLMDCVTNHVDDDIGSGKKLKCSTLDNA